MSQSPRRKVTTLLLGVFVAVLIVASGILGSTGNLPADGLLQPLRTSRIMLPLAAYTVLYARVVWAGDTQFAALPVPWMASIYVLLFLIPVYAFPLFIEYGIFGLLALLPSSVSLPVGAAFFILPFVSGVFYGAFVALSIGLGQWRRPRRILAHLAGGGVVGLLNFLAYPALENQYPALWEKGTGEIGWLLLSATVITLCYLPHLLATRPWQPEGRAHSGNIDA